MLTGLFAFSGKLYFKLGSEITQNDHSSHTVMLSGYHQMCKIFTLHILLCGIYMIKMSHELDVCVLLQSCPEENPEKRYAELMICCFYWCGFPV